VRQPPRLEGRFVHHEALCFVAEVKLRFPAHFHGAKVLEVGSLIINGTVRGLFRECHYVGIDLGPGRGVDLVGHLCDLALSPGTWDTVISCEALEHDRRWRATLRRCVELLRDRGLLVVTCAGPDRQPHGYAGAAPQCSPFTTDWYRNLTGEDVNAALADLGLTLHLECSAEDTRFWAVKHL
jgi:hypothetical protein